VLRLFSEGESNEAAYNLLCRELQILDADPSAAIPSNMLAFRLKLLLAAGFVPELGVCVGCGAEMTEVPVGGFSSQAGGVLCAGCATGGSLPLDETARAFMATALAEALKDAPTGEQSTLARVDRAVTGTLEHHAHVTLRSVATKANVARA
jgi:DNA repair protein RecO (recombination protein O)